MAAAATVAVTQASASAQPAEHQVTYTLTSAGAYEFDLFYLTAQPPSMEAFNADAYAFATREKVNVNLQVLQGLGGIRLGRGRVTLLDARALSRSK